MDPESEKIKIPTHGFVEHDEAYVEGQLGEEQTFEELVERVFASAQDLARTLRAVSAYFGDALSGLSEPSLVDLIEALERQVRAHPRDENYLKRLVGDLQDCRFANGEFERVLRVYIADPRLRWLAPLADLGDLLITATMQLQESMQMEHPDFRQGQGQ